MYKLLLFLLTVFVGTGTVKAQTSFDLSQEVPFDPSFRKGVLPNGLTYYIKQNKTPKERASYYIIQNVGSVLETDEQNGLAHFLEHMAFNGTKTFPGTSMIDFLARNGVKFGKEVNAYTAQNETVYNISKVPTLNEKVIDSCLFILRDWCNELTLDEKEIDAERGVIQEEWRSRLGLSTRVSEQTSPVKYNNTIYAERPPIGSMEVVKNFKYQALRDFYHDWYRTDLQAVAIVGDIDVDTVEKRVIELFSAIPAVQHPKARPFISIPENKKPQYVAVTDREINMPTVTLNVRHRVENSNTLNDIRTGYLNYFFNTLINNRLKDKSYQKDVHFTKGVIGNTDFVRGYKVFKISVRAKAKDLNQAFEEVFDEYQRVVKFGFDTRELEDLKTKALVNEETKYKGRHRISSDSYATAVKKSYLEGTSILDSESSYKFGKEVIASITLKELQDYARKQLTDKNRFYVVEGPEADKAVLPSLKKLEEVAKRVAKKELKPYVLQDAKDTELLTELPVGGKIVAEKLLEPYKAVEWTLSNGAKVVYRYANYKRNSVALFAESDGGSSLYGIEDIPSLAGATQYVERYGLGDHDANSLRKILSEKEASLTLRIDDYSESLSGSSTTKDIETLMQLVYMRFEVPRFDEEVYEELIEKLSESINRKVKTSKSIIDEEYKKIVNNGNPRNLEFNQEYLDQINYERVNEIYKERFSNAGDFTFYIVGDVKSEVIKPLVETYIGAITGGGKQEQWKSLQDYYPTGNHEYRIKLLDDEPKATVLVKMRDFKPYSRKELINFSIIGSILNMRYKESIREKEGGTYGVSVQALSSRNAELSSQNLMKQTLDISFGCDPEKAEYLKTLVYKELEDIKVNIKQSELDMVLENLKKNSESRTQNNKFWMSALKAYYTYNEDMTTTAYQEDILNAVTVKDIQEAAKSYLDHANVIDIIFSPETH